MIDWTQPCETTEDPPRPVRVLATDGPCAKFPVIAVVGNAFHREFSLDGRQNEVVHVIPLTLRNVAPPKPEPVQYVKWVALYSDGGSPSRFFHTKEACEAATLKHERVECRRIAWMSDGSPVPASPEQFDQMREMAVLAQDRDAWRTKAEEALSLLRQANDRVEALQAEAGRLGNDLLSAIDRRGEAELEARSLEAEIDDWKRKAIERGDMLYRQAPVVDAAVAGVDSFNRRGLLRLVEAVRTYQSQPKKTAAEAVANVVEMMGPVHPCCGCRNNDFWEAKSHD